MNSITTRRTFSFRAGFFVLISQLACVLGTSAQENIQLSSNVTKGDLKIEVEIAGVFVADDKDEIRMEPSKYRGDLIITKLLPEGTAVKKGDVLMEFDTDKLDDALEESQNEVTDAEVQLKTANAEHESAQIDFDSNLGQLQKELAFAKRDVEAAVERQALDLAEKEKELSDEVHALADANVDFEQLRQLYDERELHTATENILIKRTKKRIENREKSIDVKKQEISFYKKFDKSKTQFEKELEVDKKQAEIRKQKITLEAAVAEKKSLVEKAKRTLDTAKRKTAGLKEDRDVLRVVSPRNGILFYRTTGDESPLGGVMIAMGGSSQGEMRVGGRVKTHSVLLTVAAMDNLSIKMDVMESDIQHMKKDLPITVRPDAFPSLQLSGSLTKVDQIASRTHFLTNARRFTVKGKCAERTPQLRSGMSCRVTVHANVVPNATQIPIVAVFEEGGKYFCFVKSGSTSRKREIKIGVSNDEHVQITEGLRSGEVVCLSDPNRAN